MIISSLSKLLHRLCILRLYSTSKVAPFWRWMKQVITQFSVLKCSETLWDKVLYICTRGIISRQQLCQMLNWDWSLTAELLTFGNRSLNCKCWPNLTSGGANGNSEKLCSFHLLYKDKTNILSFTLCFFSPVNLDKLVGKIIMPVLSKQYFNLLTPIQQENHEGKLLSSLVCKWKRILLLAFSVLPSENTTNAQGKHAMRPVGPNA